MPGGDRTGPMGMGSRTGRAAGYCSGSQVAGFANPIPGFGAGFGGRGFMGGGRGWRHWFYATGLPGWRRSGWYGAPSEYVPQYDPELEKQGLKNQADALQAQLDFINMRLAQFETESAAD